MNVNEIGVYVSLILLSLCVNKQFFFPRKISFDASQQKNFLCQSRYVCVTNTIQNTIVVAHSVLVVLVFNRRDLALSNYKVNRN